MDIDAEDVAWLGRDDLGTVRKGDVIKSIYRALTVFGIADRVDRNGDWRNQRGGLLIPSAEACFTILQSANEATIELIPDPGTMIAATIGGVEHTLIWSQVDGWLQATTGDVVDLDRRWDSWRLLAGEVNQVGG